MSNNSFISLHNHTVYSKLDSMVKIKPFVKLAKEYGMKSLSVTDHGTCSSLIEFYRECKAQDINPILGCEIYLTEDRLIKTRKEMLELEYYTYHLILLAKDNIGLTNLYAIASEAATNGYFDGYERIDLKYIRDNNLAEGIVCSSGCLGGPIASWLLQKKERMPNKDKALQWANELKETFNDFYIELGCNNTEEQKIINQELIVIAEQNDIPLIIAGDTHYLYKEDAEIHEVLLCMNTSDVLSNPDRWKFTCDENYLWKPEDVYKYCIENNIPLSAIDNTAKIASSCKVNPLSEGPNDLLPPYEVPIGYTEDTYLAKQCKEGLLRLALENEKIDYATYYKRLAYELDIVGLKGFSGYFLIVGDIFNYCEENKIPIGIRGSAAGCLIAYALGISELDPIEHGFFFERFLNLDKMAFPDIDIDVGDNKREQVKDYILSKYEYENVAQINSKSYVKLRSGLERIMKVYSYKQDVINMVKDTIPEKLPDQTECSYKKFVDIRDNPDKYDEEYGHTKFVPIKKLVAEFWNYMGQFPEINKALFNLEGTIYAFGCHAGGIIITPKGKLQSAFPVKLSKNDLPTSQYDMADIEYIAALKLDLLGVCTYSIVDIACNLADIPLKVLRPKSFDLHPELYETIRNGLTTEVFQLASPGMTKLCQNINIDRFTELIDVIGLFRPGPLTAVDDETGLTMVETYIKSKAENIVTSIHKDIDEILSISKGCIVFQEQLIAIGQIIGGYTLGRSDLKIRKGTAKKNKTLLLSVKEEFIYGSKNYNCSCGNKGEYNLQYIDDTVKCSKCNNVITNGVTITPGAIALGYDESFANNIFEMIVKFSG